MRGGGAAAPCAPPLHAHARRCCRRTAAAPHAPQAQLLVPQVVRLLLPPARRRARSPCCTCAALPWAPLVSPADTWGLLAALSACAAAGAHAGKRTAAGRALSGPVCAMLLAWTAHGAGILPPPVRPRERSERTHAQMHASKHALTARV
jgi:hypothetical protein